MELQKLFEDLTPEKAKILKEQIERFELCKRYDIKSVNIDNKIELPVGTLIHGTSCRSDVLSSISETGIISGQVFGIPEDGETFYCADFHRVDKEQSLEEYNQNFSYVDGRCPFGNKGKQKVAFIIFPNEELKELAKYDCYRSDTQAAYDTKTFVNMQGLPIENSEKAASILFGVPSCFISGIVLGDNCVTPEVVEFIKSKFPGAFITRNTGELLYKNGDTKEMTDLRIEKVKMSIQNDVNLRRIKMLTDDLERSGSEKEEMWDAISKLPIESIAQIYENLGYQGDILAQAESFKTRRAK